MDVNKVMQALQSHEELQNQLEATIQKDDKEDKTLKNSLINKRDAKIYEMQKLEDEYRNLTNLEKKLIEKDHHRNINLIQQIDKRSTYSKFK